MTQLALPACVLPGCSNPVATVGEPCGTCKRDFGSMLRCTGPTNLTPEQIEHQLAERDSYVHRAYQLQRMIREGA